MSDLEALLACRIRDVADFPRPGITFKDIGPLLADPTAFARAVDAMASRYDAGRVDKVAGIEARGFILGAAIAYRLEAGFVALRKAGKLPGPTHAASYVLEYGEATLEVGCDGFGSGDRVVLVDDVLATGGTMAAAAGLVERSGAEVVACAVLLELSALHGRSRLGDRALHVLLATST